MKAPERRLGAFLVLLSVLATRGGCPIFPAAADLADEPVVLMPV
jgi:hypothetical protein